MANKFYSLIEEYEEHSGIKYKKGDKIGLGEHQIEKFAELGLIEKPKRKYNKTKTTEKVEVKTEKKD
jgi:hypothetical protein